MTIEELDTAVPGQVRGTRPYPWPYDGPVDPAATALLVVAAGPVAAAPTNEELASIERLGLELPAIGVRLVWALTRARAGPWVTLPTPRQADMELECPGLNAFEYTALDPGLRAAGVRHVVIAGVGLELGVHSTLRRANDLGYECLLVEDACSSLDPGLRAGAVKTVEMSGGIFGAVGSTSELLAAVGASRR